MAGALDRIFSPDNLLQYSGACIDLAVSIPDKKKTHPFDTLVIPSRGAVPFFFGMNYALPLLGEMSSAHMDFYKTLEVSTLLPSLSHLNQVDQVGEKKTKVLLIPFTADLNVARFDPKADNDEYTKKTREYWAKVTAAFFREPSFRKNDPYFNTFTDTILREIEARDEIAKFYESFPRVNNIALIDTVISGRASNDILQAFDGIAQSEKDEKYLPTSFLIVDDDGQKLRPKFHTYLKRKELTGQVSMYNVPAIVSEDRGAALLGVCATIYPSIMRASKGLSYGGKEFFVGAGSWYASSTLGSGNLYHASFSKFMDTVFKGIDLKFSQDYGSPNQDLKEAAFNRSHKSLLDYLGNERIMNHTDADTTVLGYNPAYRPSNTYETHSHVVHVPFNEATTNRIMQKIQQDNMFVVAQQE